MISSIFLMSGYIRSYASALRSWACNGGDRVSVMVRETVKQHPDLIRIQVKGILIDALYLDILVRNHKTIHQQGLRGYS